MNDDWRIVLYNSGQVVVYNRSENSLALRHYNENTLAVCPTCLRPLSADSYDSARHYMDRNYFRLLSEARSNSFMGIPSPLSETSGSFNEGYYAKFFIEQEKLGRGFRGNVYLCQHMLDGISLGSFAVKKIPVGDHHDWLVKMLKEVTLLEKLRHPNVIEYKHAWLEPHQIHQFGPRVPTLFILMERANGGSLQDYIEVDSRKVEISIDASLNGGIGYNDKGILVRFLRETEIWSLFTDICKGLMHLHLNGVIHRDLKPQNLLLEFDKSEIPRVLISDFGECEIMEKLTGLARSGATGTMEFMAPELLYQSPDGIYTETYSQRADIWSLGIILYYLCYSTVPYSQVDDVDILKQEIQAYREPKLPTEKRISPFLKDLLLRMLSVDPIKRPLMPEILEICKSSERLVFKAIQYPNPPENWHILLQILVLYLRCFPATLKWSLFLVFGILNYYFVKYKIEQFYLVLLAIAIALNKTSAVCS